ncbi:cytochrome P460 family protein [Dongia deserti]|uniref:cytochrome P460 family protein n=1 Tax=Dongia deserti TaxID=2268030 RepID=UPI002548764C|nr:cytochrome P460 family protein [Dongia deserti]
MTSFLKGTSPAMRRFLPGVLVLSSAFAIMAAVAHSEWDTAEAASDPQTLLHVPNVDYRRDWTLLGSFSVLADDPEAGAKEFHVVYTLPENVDAYRKTGAFPDGAVLVKDVFATNTEAMTTGTSSYADTLIGRFVMVRDEANKYAGASPLWGEGWGWAFYDGTEKVKTVSTDYKQDCLGCHEPVRNQNFLHFQGYPILKN